MRLRYPDLLCPDAAVRQIVDPLQDGLQNLEQSAQKVRLYSTLHSVTSLSAAYVDAIHWISWTC